MFFRYHDLNSPNNAQILVIIMFRLLFLLFLIIPVIEIYLLIQVGSMIGALNTVGLVVGTAILGAYLLKRQGLSTLARVQDTMARGEIPAIEMMEGIILLITGALLLTPGFFTDILGFLGLIPMIRRNFIIWLLKKGSFIQFGGPRGPSGPTPNGPGAIEGEFRREDWFFRNPTLDYPFFDPIISTHWQWVLKKLIKRFI